MASLEFPSSPLRDNHVRGDSAEKPTPSEAATPQRLFATTPGQTPASELRTPAVPMPSMDSAERLSLRLAMELQGEEEQYFASQRQGEERLARIEAEKRVAARVAAAANGESTPVRGGVDEGADAVPESADGARDGARESGESDSEEEIDDSLALAWRLQQEDDDNALLTALNNGVEPSLAHALRNVSPSQMTFAQLTELGENIGVVSKGATRSAIDNLKTCCYRDAAANNAIVGEQCAICRVEFEPDDVMRVLPCRHSEHAECIDQWLLMNRCCPLCQKEVAPRAGAAHEADDQCLTAADTDDIDELLGF